MLTHRNIRYNKLNKIKPNNINIIGKRKSYLTKMKLTRSKNVTGGITFSV